MTIPCLQAPRIARRWWKAFLPIIRARLATAEADALEMREALQRIADYLPYFDYVAHDSYGHVQPDRPGSPYDRGKADASKHLSEIARAALKPKGQK